MQRGATFPAAPEQALTWQESCGRRSGGWAGVSDRAIAAPRLPRFLALVSSALLAATVSLVMASPAFAAGFTGVEFVQSIAVGSGGAGSGEVVAGAEGGGSFFYLERYDGFDNSMPTMALSRSDGTRNGTARVKALDPPEEPDRFPYYRGEMVNAGGTLYIVVERSEIGIWDLWTTDGTAGGTKFVESLDAQYRGSLKEEPQLLTAASGDIFFTMWTEPHGWELWTSDGTAAGTGMVTDIIAGPTDSVDGRYSFEDRRFVFEGGYLYFLAHPTEEDESSGNQALFRTDGTAAGTKQVVPVHDGSAGPTAGCDGGLARLGGKVYCYRADIGYQADGSLEVWAHDGDGLDLIVDIETDGNAAGPLAIWSAAGRIFVFLTEGYLTRPWDSENQLWQSDGTPGGVVTKDHSNFLGTIGSHPSTNTTTPLTTAELGGATIFAAGDQLWRSDRTRAGTYRLGTVEVDPHHWGGPDGYGGWITTAGDHAYFVGSDFDHGWEPWRTDGTAAGTAPMVDIDPGRSNSDPRWLTGLGSELVLTARDPEIGGRALWRGDHGNGVTIDRPDGGGGDGGGGDGGGGDGGDGDGGDGGSNGEGDVRSPEGQAKVTGRTRAGKKIKVVARSDEAGIIVGKGKAVAKKRKNKRKTRAVAAGKNRKKFKLKKDRERVSAGEKVTLKLKVRGKKNRRKLRRLGKRKQWKTKAKVVVIFRDQAGNKSKEKLRVRLR